LPDTAASSSGRVSRPAVYSAHMQETRAPRVNCVCQPRRNVCPAALTTCGQIRGASYGRLRLTEDVRASKLQCTASRAVSGPRCAPRPTSRPTCRTQTGTRSTQISTALLLLTTGACNWYVSVAFTEPQRLPVACLWRVCGVCFVSSRPLGLQIVTGSRFGRPISPRCYARIARSPAMSTTRYADSRVLSTPRQSTDPTRIVHLFCMTAPAARAAMQPCSTDSFVDGACSNAHTDSVS
jgi:hypothetical protein